MAIRIVAAFILGLLLVTGTSATSGGAVLCRESSFQGLDYLAKAAHTLLGPNTTDASKIRLFLTKEEGVTYVQSNFLSDDPDHPGRHSEYPAKIRTNDLHDIQTALVNIIYWGDPPADSTEAISKALSSVVVLVDQAAIDQNGRVDVDISGVRAIKLTNRSQEINAGEISTLQLEKPPPALVETISGCCLKGRPPGRAAEIYAQLGSRKIDPQNLTMLSLVVDSGTAATIARSSILSKASLRAGVTAADDWSHKLEKAMSSAKGGTLILLTHINGKNVEVLDSGQRVLFSAPVSELRQKAKETGVDLILFGCDTASFIDEQSDSIGVSGIYNTAKAASLLGVALPSSSDVGSLMKAVASPGLTLVAYDEGGGNGYAGASAFARVRHTGVWARVFRLLSIPGRT